MTDSLTKQKRKLDVRTVDTGSTRKGYSTGDVISDQGQVLQLRVGEHVLRVTGGALWTVPLQDQASGQALVEQVDTGYRARGTFCWTATPIGQGKVRVDAKVAYSSPDPLSFEAGLYAWQMDIHLQRRTRTGGLPPSPRCEAWDPPSPIVMTTELKLR